MTIPLVTIIGTYLSPYVRKVLVCLDLKNVAYEIDPIVPFFGNEDFTRISPVRRIPVLIDDCVTLPDSSVICEYLEERYPSPPLFPRQPAERARARWLEEFADTRMGEVFIWRLFNQLVIKPVVWGEKTDDEVVRKTSEEEIPEVLDHPSFVKLRPFEELLIRTPIPHHRDAVRDAGAPLTASTLGSQTARRGILSI